MRTLRGGSFSSAVFSSLNLPVREYGNDGLFTSGQHRRRLVLARPSLNLSHRYSLSLVCPAQPVVAREPRRHPRPAGHAARVPDVGDDETA